MTYGIDNIAGDGYYCHSPASIISAIANQPFVLWVEKGAAMIVS
jgi:hypothetical protein